MNASTATNNSKFGVIETLFWSLMAVSAIADLGFGYSVNFYVFDAIYLVPFVIQLARFCSNHVLDEKVVHVETAGRVIDVMTIICGAILPIGSVVATIVYAAQGMFEVWYLITPALLLLKFAGIVWLVRSYWSRH